MFDLSFYEGKRVLITGHTGFKGTWLCAILKMVGAKVIGYALEPLTNPSVFALTNMDFGMKSIIGDIRDLTHLEEVFNENQPEIVLHLAAQPIVRTSYKEPVITYETNVMGTVNVLECVRKSNSVKSVVNITTDKVYKNKEWEWGYRENEELCGFDPYSNSKSCSELVTDSYKNSFLDSLKVAVSTVRAGNVIGGGDFATDRIIPDCIHSIIENKDIPVRNPYSTRPYQHVLEPLVAYLMIAKEQFEHPELASSYNVGPNEVDCVTTGTLVTQFCDAWKRQSGHAVQWINLHDGGPHEAGLLKLDCAKIKSTFGWKPVWHTEHAMEKLVEWYLSWMKKEDLDACMKKQIEAYLVDIRK